MSRIDEIKRRHQNRKKEGRSRYPLNGDSSDSYDHHPPEPRPDRGDSEGPHPLFRTNIFILKCMVAACLVLAVGIVYKQSGASFKPIQTAVASSLSNDFKFARVSNWYEDIFGKPMAFLPVIGGKEDKAAEKEKKGADFAAPVSGRVQEFSKAKKGVMVRTAANSSVTAVQDGLVTFVGKKDETGETVVIQHSDGTESWYGKLSEVNVKNYDFVKKGQKIGKVSDAEKGKSGSFYFALKEDKKFIDPVQVFKFE
ncbi:stage IV sporulation protein FA [Scopulibacillus darangshiensis]|uniref:Stage IV sporulation protein FA n=1 Tax=Scopulibacillus darangshiensis TaxID=442528 RepID=A0A4R2PB53_9BACL|nr:M23 family metallopeptidase [Scopulibacillus darangshiensis]TCP32242.1 stage IV sporulation protein FA [Scopulibacillus darangshiensis]